jgi:hypothetical protein
MPAIQLDDMKQRMATIRESFGQQINTIRDNRNYSERGRAREMAKTLLAHRKKADALRANFDANNETVRVKLGARLFGLPAGADATTVLVYRDAEDRAAKITSQENAAAMLTRALERGDTLLARAVAGHAYSKHWGDVTETWAEKTGLADALDALDEIPSGRMLNIAEAVVFSVSSPPELRAFASDSDLQRLADEEDQ